MPGPVSIVMLTHGKLEYTRACVEALVRTTRDFELVVVDNASSDDTPRYLRRLERERGDVTVVLNHENRGFAAGCNQGVAIAAHKTVCLLNNDTVPHEDWLPPMVEALGEGVGAVGALLLLPEGTIQHCGIEFERIESPHPHYWPYHRLLGFPPELEEASSQREVPGVTGACLLTTKAAWDRVGGMDEGYAIANFEDVDYNLALRRAGYRVLYEPRARLTHYWGTTVSAKGDAPDSPRRFFQANYERMMSKWFGALEAGLAS